MKCDYHPYSEAVGVCFICSRHVCSECSDLLTGKVICRQCKSKVASRLHQDMLKQQSEGRQLSYALPIIVILAGIMNLIVSFVIDISIFLIISLILLTIGVAYFVIIYAVRKKGQYLKEDKPTRSKITGWILVSLGALILIVLPAIGLSKISINGVVVLVSLVLSFSLIILGAKMAR